MAFWIASSPHNHIKYTTSSLMRLVIYATIPGIFAQWFYFGWGNLIHISIAIFTALVAEFIVLSLRNNNVKAQLFDGSAVLTAVLLGIGMPALAPWWISVIGTIFAIVVVKQLYGGLGHNPFNPAMAGYVMLLVSFPLQMTTWQPPLTLINGELSLQDTLSVILTGFTYEGYSIAQIITQADGFTMATPLDAVKTGLSQGYTVLESMDIAIFNEGYGIGWFWINMGFFIGGLFLLLKKTIHWTTPVSFLSSLFICSFIAFVHNPDGNASSLFHLFSGATMLGAFFILTDPVSGATSVKGRLIVGALAGLLVYLIRTVGGYPDAVAFATLLCNMSAPLIDQFTRPRTYGHSLGGK